MMKIGDEVFSKNGVEFYSEIVAIQGNKVTVKYNGNYEETNTVDISCFDKMDEDSYQVPNWTFDFEQIKGQILNIKILNGDYKNHIVETFTKGVELYFRDDEKDIDVSLKNFKWKSISNIPIYRAKKINSSEYVKGFYLLVRTDTEEFHFIVQDVSDARDIGIDYPVPLIEIDFEIDLSTLAIHFPDMLDSDDKEIFASLSEDGKGGDIVDIPYITPKGEVTDSLDFKAVIVLKNGVVQIDGFRQRAVREMMSDSKEGEYVSNFGNPIVFGTTAIFKTTGIQE